MKTLRKSEEFETPKNIYKDLGHFMNKQRFIYEVLVGMDGGYIS